MQLEVISYAMKIKLEDFFQPFTWKLIQLQFETSNLALLEFAHSSPRKGTHQLMRSESFVPLTAKITSGCSFSIYEH